jgi:hypothetical protein
VIEAVAATPYRDWIVRHVVSKAGLKETAPDMPLADATPFARGHTGPWPTGRR